MLTPEGAAHLAAAYRDADMAILAQHGTLVTGASAALALVRALSFEWRCRVAYQVARTGRTPEPLDPKTADALGHYAQEYGEMLLEAYGREEIARDPSLLD